MVMGVDDFRQEQTHFEWKNSLSNLLLHGYGTVCGLAVTTEQTEDGNDVLVRIAKGYGVSPQGHWIWVDREQCAQLGAWIAANPPPPPTSLPAPRQVYVRLCYDECLTELVPVAGRPCATDEDTRAPSRIQEAFQAQFTWEQPAQPAEALTRAFGALLRQVVLTHDMTSPGEDDSASLLSAVRALGSEFLGSPPDTSPPEPSPPAGEFVLPAATACATLRDALTIWVTEVCPRYQDETGADCILLACIVVELDENNTLLVDSVAADACDRPILASSRLQQELFCLLNTAGVTDHSALENLDADDHAQYLRTDGTRPLAGDQSAGGNRITNLAAAIQNGDAVRFEQAIKQGDVAGGDLRGNYPDPQVRALQTRRVVMPPGGAPIPNGNVLTWTGAQWEPRAVPGGGPVTGDFVLRPTAAGAYAVLAAGIFEETGAPFRGASPYNELTANQINVGQYLLNFPGYSPQIVEFATLIVKGTIVNLPLVEFPDLDVGDLLNVEDEMVANSFGDRDFALNLHMFPANFQVVDFTAEGILVWITQPMLRPRMLQAIAEGQFDNSEFGLLHFTPVNKPFMVEISAYGPEVERALAGEAPRLININRATVDDLLTLPGIGRVLATRIVAERPAGGFASIEALRNIPGMTAARLAEVRRLITL